VLYYINIRYNENEVMDSSNIRINIGRVDKEDQK